ncbi:MULTISPECIES: hypothetical protein [unclassified Nocardioides]|uniref:hypothetical protein n=1 Tax=unclassified Nocardioides TaxID=2615069 RepID=UPI0007036FFD|nr:MULTISPECIES: hypothetical protein [unclassified Nocardioides]KRC53935.1 hypothetical protein ASE19_07595 [Nocardioides sp. Root79]KRC71271.1 hypothetical protein ASE20_10010 [Nocardioides sp. Root240]
MKRTYRGDRPLVAGREGPGKNGGAFGIRSLRKRVAELERKKAAGGLTRTESVALQRFKQVLPPDREAEIRLALGLNEQEN